MIKGTVIQASTIPPIKHDEAMAITEVENDRLGEVLADVTPEQWTLPTDCTRWDVRAVADTSSPAPRRRHHQAR